MRWLWLLPLAGCTSMTVTGTVVDPGGGPVEGAMVSLVGTLCQATTMEDGSFEIPCSPGRYRVIASYEGWHAAEATVAAEERRPYDVGALEVMPIPPASGVWILSGRTFTQPEPGHLQKVEAERSKAYCVLPDTPVTEVPARLRLVDRHADDWKLLRLDDEGCAQRLAWESGRWRPTYQETPESGERRVGEDVVHTFNLDSGEYVLAPWPSGRFQVDLAGSDAAGDKRYNAARLRVP